MAKLPTLNVDVRVNTRTMQKDIDAANKRLQNIGGKGLAFAGGTAGKLGSLGALGGSAGSAAIGAGAAALTAAAPFMIANRVIDSFSSSVQNATQFLEKQQSDMTLNAYRELGISQLFAERLAAAAETSDMLAASNKGMWDSFWAAAANDQGQVGGVMGSILDAAQSTMESLKTVIAGGGALLGGKGFLPSVVEALSATSAGDWSAELRGAQALEPVMGTSFNRRDVGMQMAADPQGTLAIANLLKSFSDLFG
jgi:hypothetical protein